jgi:hypothetical protein
MDEYYHSPQWQLETGPDIANQSQRLLHQGRAASGPPTGTDGERDYLLMGQVPGASQGAGVNLVVAVTSAKGEPSAPFTTAETRQ